MGYEHWGCRLGWRAGRRDGQTDLMVYEQSLHVDDTAESRIDPAWDSGRDKVHDVGIAAMARRFPETNGEIPPVSTLAAQIVQKQTGRTLAQQDNESATLPHLLHEILHNPVAVQETNVHVNAQLIRVVAEAGLAPLAYDEPLGQYDLLIRLAADSIAVIERTVCQQPTVLATTDGQHGPPLSLSLIARLAAICGRPKCEELHVGGLLDNILQNTDGTRLRLISRVDAVVALENSCTYGTNLALSLPSDRVIADLWPQSEGVLMVQRVPRASINHETQAFMFAIELSSLSHLSKAWRHDIRLKLQRILWQIKAKLLQTGQWSRAVEMLLLPLDGLTVLERLLLEITDLLPSSEVQTSISQALIRILQCNELFTHNTVLIALVQVAGSPEFLELQDDLRIAIAIWLNRFVIDSELPTQVIPLLEALRQGNSMDDSGLQVEFDRLSHPRDHGHQNMRSAERRKSDREPGAEERSVALQNLASLITDGHDAELSALIKAGTDMYPGLDKNAQCTMWHLLARIAVTEPSVAIQMVSSLIQLPELRQSKKMRVLAMVALKEAAKHSKDPNYVDLAESPSGQFCLGSLHSSLRELRIAASICLPSFLREDLPASLRTHNRQMALEYLRNVSDRNVVNEQETLIRAWSSVGSVCGDRELNLILLRLVDYLGHPNALISAVASEEIERLAESKSMKVGDMLALYLDSIALTVVRDLISRPQKSQQFCELLGNTVNRFLVRTQQLTTPSLVLTKRVDILIRIAHARDENSSVKDLCLQPITNLAAILALLLEQSNSEPEAFAMNCLTSVAPDLSSIDIASLIKLDPVLVACEMLKYGGGVSPDGKSRVYRAFEMFTSIVERPNGKNKSHAKSKRNVADFFAAHVLGIMSYFSDILENARGPQPTTLKIRCLHAIADMIALAGGQASIALPQIRACLSSAMQQPGLCESAFSAWLTLLPMLDSEDIALVINQTFALIVKFWDDFSSELQTSTHERVADLFKTHSHVIQENVMTLPSLHTIPLLAKFASEVERLKVQDSIEGHCKAFAKRLRDESETVTLQALQELYPFLIQHQETIHDSAISEQPPQSLSDLLRALLDTTTQYASGDSLAAVWCGKSLGVLGCLDPDRVEVVRKRRQLLVLSDFETSSEAVDWVAVLLEDVLVNVFRSTANARAQGFLAFVIQELLRFCKFTQDVALRSRGSTQPLNGQQRWLMMPEHIRLTLTPFLNSRYMVTSNVSNQTSDRLYPGFVAGTPHNTWLRSLVYDLMWKGKGDNAKILFPLLARIVRGHDLTIASFILPYAMLNVVLGGTLKEVKGISDELLAVLTCQASTTVQQDTIRLCSESVFAVLDYMSTWLQEKKKALGETRAAAYRTGASPNGFDEAKDMGQIGTIESFLDSIPAEAIASRSSECGSFARALFHWEKYIRQKRSIIPSSRMDRNDEELFERLQSIYAHIDDPDGLEGIGAHLSFLNEEQQVMQHMKAGRWTAAQARYEVYLAQDPDDLAVQTSLLNCLRETGQYTSMLKFADAFTISSPLPSQEQKISTLPFVLEALWMNEDIKGLAERLEAIEPLSLTDFHTGVAKALVSSTVDGTQTLDNVITCLRRTITESMTVSGTNSLHACNDELRKLSALHEIETLKTCNEAQYESSLGVFEKRQAALGGYLQDKEFTLGIRRAVMQSRPDVFTTLQIGRTWLATARLARKSDKALSAYSAVLRASECGDNGAKLEQARLLWRDGHQRQAIQVLDAAINSGVFDATEESLRMENSNGSAAITQRQNLTLAKAHLLLAKWLDVSGQSQTSDLTAKYQYAARIFQRWEKGHYSLGKHYNKLLEAEKALPTEKQKVAFQTGEMTKTVIENLMRSVPFGTKFWHETIPKILTLWLDLGMDTLTRSRNEDQTIFERRVKTLQGVNRQVQKYCDRIPSYVFYTAFPQLISRISHPHPEVWKTLSNILTKVVAQHPSQALWSLLAVIRSADRTRVDRGQEIVNRLKDPKNKLKSDLTPSDLRNMISQGQKLQDGLLQACECHVEPRKSSASLSKDLGFNHKLAPSSLVVPVEATLLASIPNSANADAERIRKHRPFTQEKITIQSFSDDVLVLSSLQRPRKITVRGTDGKQYGLLCKPKDDLRKDQRLMEFNGIINRALKRDAKSSKRRLYIKTYAVTPLSEESGTIEWVEGIKPIRDILLSIYSRKGVRPNYNDIRSVLNEACEGPGKVHLFNDQVLSRFPPSLHEWFTEVYSEPETWFNARLRYARSAAVMSITGHVLGLGDRHGENILLEEGTGGVFHVDFNCLFDKGLTFEKPELVPFRLTHNMVDAMGPYGYEGPFRKSCELTLGLLRRDKDTLMTILETFLYDPTTDFIGGKKKRSTAGVPETPREILESVDRKVKGLLQGDTVPLSVEGYVDALIRQAVDPANLAAMYIGWCAFL
nr:protein kinase rad3 [Quercus suber]